MENKNNKPTHFLILKILGFVFIAVGIVGIVLSITGFSDFESNNYMIGGLLTCFGLFGGVVCLVSGFRPEIMKITTKSAKYIQQENKEDLTDIANTSADIASGALTKTAKAIKEGIKDNMFCKHCGAEIDKDSKFCKSCGKEQ